MSSPDDVEQLVAGLSDMQLAELDALLASDRRPWRPNPGTQMMAAESLADIVGFGGAAGGGKTDLCLGLATTEHQKVAIFRETGTEMTAVVDRLAELLGSRDGYNGSDRIWRFTRYDGVPCQIELGSFPNPGDEQKYRGRPHDLIVFDEAACMRETPVRFLLGWLRTVDPKQRCRTVLGFNPPSTIEGQWIIAFFAPWLDKQHPKPAMPGELRWFATIAGKDVEVENGEPFVRDGELIRPLSRTFIPSRVHDNPFLRDTQYVAQLQALPEPLRSQLLYGDFHAVVQDDPWQVIPTAWVDAAMARWSKPAKLPPMDSTGIDVARGGKDQTVIARRHGMWFDAPLVYPGKDTPDGAVVAGLAVAAGRDGAVHHIDVIGVGASPYDFLVQLGQQAVGVNVAESSTGLDKSGRLRFANTRSELWWRLREALDPTNNTGIALPPDKDLRRDLCTPWWRVRGMAVAVASRDEIIDKLQRSPDLGSAYALALIETPKVKTLRAIERHRQAPVDYDPRDAVPRGMRSVLDDYRPV